MGYYTDRVLSLAKEKGLFEMNGNDVQILVQIYRDYFVEDMLFADPVSGLVSKQAGINWSKCTAEFVHNTLKKHKKL